MTMDGKLPTMVSEHPLANGSGGGMTVRLGKGTNQLTFNYQLPLLRSGIFLSVVGVGLLGANYYYERRKRQMTEH